MKKKISLWLILLVVIGMPFLAFAKTPEGFYTGNDVSVAEDQNRTTFAAGEKVEFTPITIDGLSFAAGSRLSISSKQDHLFAAGETILLNEAVTKDAYLAGRSIKIESSTVRDLFAAAEKIEIYSSIRNAYLGGNTVIIDAPVEGNIKISAETIEIGENANIQGTLTYPKEADITISEKSVIEKTKTYEKAVEEKETFKDTIVSKTASLVSLLVIGIILLTIFPALFENWKKEDKDASSCIKKALIGLLTLIVTPIAAIILLITIIGIPISLITIALYLILIYLSKVVAAYYIGSWVLKSHEMNNYLLLSGSLLVIFLLEMIPVVGGWIKFLILILGMGIVVMSKKNSQEEKK
ncbi:MAG: hypothetical protein IJI60_00615 [Bacilli bacterium]|nr:hypothetical protein [Bacilli bacterium]